MEIGWRDHTISIGNVREKIASVILVWPFRTILIVSLLYVQALSGQPIENIKKIEAIYDAVNLHLYDKEAKAYFKYTETRESAFLWDICALIQAANEAESVDSSRHYLFPVLSALKAYTSRKGILGYRSTRAISGERYYDDNEWLGIAFLAIYKRTKNPWFLQRANDICRFVMSGCDTIPEGGIFWKEDDRGSKNTCSNAPAILLLLRLHEITGEKEYLFIALKLYSWINRYLQADDGTYWDAVRYMRSIHFIDKSVFSYNTGTMLEVNVEFYKATKQRYYLREAKRLAEAAYNIFLKDGVKDTSYWFNAVMLRGFESLYQIDRNDKYMLAFSDHAASVWVSERDQRNLIGRSHRKELLHQAGMIEIFSRLKRFQKSNSIGRGK